MLTVTYNSFNLATTNYSANPAYLARIKQVYSAPTISTQSESIATRNGSKFLNRYYTAKTITIEGSITANSLSSLQAAIDAMQRALLTPQANLDIGYENGVRRYVATPTNVQFPHTGKNAMTIDFAVDFLCSFPFGAGLINDSFSSSGITVSPHNLTSTYNGTAPLNPIFTLTINSQTNMTQAQIEYVQGNQSVIISPATFADGDIFIINTLTGDVTQNGLDIEFTGFLPELLPGSATIRLTITDTGAFNANLAVQSTPFYL
jgi:phage-related protein